MASDDIKLNPCPFCAGAAEVHDATDGGGGNWICCGRCGTRTVVQFSLAQLAELWNRRATPAAATRDVARLEAIHDAVAALYFDDSSRFRSALGAVIRNLDPALAGEVLAWPKQAYETSMARLYVARAASKKEG